MTLEGVDALNQHFKELNAYERVRYALNHFPAVHALTSSFGAQAAVSLHLLTQAQPHIPIIMLDTGYLFAETYRFAEELQRSLGLNLHVYRSVRSPAWQEAIDGQRWLNGTAGIEDYNQENKVEPLKRALSELKVGTWFTGLRREQAESRAATPFVQVSGNQIKCNPIADWNDRNVHHYLQDHDLPYHPLWHQGYISIGDTHTTRSIHEVESAEHTRFFGLKRECGIHDLAPPTNDQGE